MKIFPRYHLLRLYRASGLNEVLSVLEPWIDEVLYPGSPFLRQVASYHLKRAGGANAPRLFKNILGNEILRLNESEDLVASVRLAIVASYLRFKPGRGDVDLVNWLSWNIPYEVSKLVMCLVVHPIGPFEEAFLPREVDEFERTFEVERQAAIICDDLGLEKQTKYYYLRKVRQNNEAYC